MIAGGGPVIAPWDAWTAADDGHQTRAITELPGGQAAIIPPSLPDERHA